MKKYILVNDGHQNYKMNQFQKASYKKISLVVQYRINKIKVSIDLKSIKWVTDEYSTSSLINWSNVVIHFGTTMQFECFQKPGA